MSFTKEDTKVIKGIAILFMLYHHLFAFSSRILECNMYIPLISFGETNFATYLAQYLSIEMPMFIFFSGFGTYISALRERDLQKMIVRRIWGLYKLVWMVFFLSLPISIYVHRAEGSLLLRETIYNALGLSCSFNEEWWFVVPFALTIVFFPAVRAFLERKGSMPVTDILCVVAYRGVYNYVLPEIISLPVFAKLEPTVLWDNINLTLGMLPTFTLGCIFAKYKILDYIKEKMGGRLIWCIAALAGFAATFYLRLYNYKYYEWVNATVLICCITVLLPLKIMKLPYRIFGIIGNESTFMWLTHTFFCYYWCQRFIYAPKYTPLIFILLVLVSFTTSKFIKLFWKFFGKAADRLSGNKAIWEASK